MSYKPESMATAAAYLDAHFKAEPHIFEIGQPCKVTRASKHTSVAGVTTWKYSKTPFVGTEELVPCSVRVGKSGRMILRFALRDDAMTDGDFFEEGEFNPEGLDTYFEMHHKEAFENLDETFLATVDAVLGKDFEKQMKAARARKEQAQSNDEVEEKAKRKQAIAADPRYSHYGTW